MLKKMRSALPGSIKNTPGRSGVPLTLIAPLRASALRSATAPPPLQPGATFNKARAIEKQPPSLRAKRSNPQLSKPPKPRKKSYFPPFVSEPLSAPLSSESSSNSSSESSPKFSSSLPSESSSSKSSDSSASSSSSSSS